MTERPKGDGGDLVGRNGLGVEAESISAVAPVTDLASLEAAADVYGGELEHWPAARRDEAQALLDADLPGARMLLRSEARLDALLAMEARRSEPFGASLEALQERMFADALRNAPTRPAAGKNPHGWASFAVGAAQLLGRLADRLEEQLSGDRGLTLGGSAVGFRSMGGLGAAAAAAGLAFGLLNPLGLPSSESGGSSLGGAQVAYEDVLDGEESFDLFAASRENFGAYDELYEELDG